MTEAAVNDLLGFYRQGAELRDFDTGVQYALARILSDPRFVYRFEHEPEEIKVGDSYAINGHELASRLSFFLWSSIPDDELLRAAGAGELRQAKKLEQQIDRMLADPRADALVQNFAAQWLGLRQLATINPTSTEYDGTLRESMKRETELLFSSILREDRSVLDLLNADYTFVDERLARHYGIAHIQGSQFRRVPVSDANRRGILGHASVLTLTSAPNRTSVGQAWPVGIGKPARHTAAATTAGCGGQTGSATGTRCRANHLAAAHGAAPGQSLVWCMPWGDRPHRHRAGKLRCHRQVA